MKHHTRIGIVGGCQLGKMLALSAKQMGFYVAITDPTPQSPAGQVSDFQIVAGYKDEKAIRQLAKLVDVITFEIESASDKVLLELMKKGKTVHPSPKTLKIIRDKFIQKQFLKKHSIPTAQFKKVSNYNDIVKAAKIFNYPLLLKARTDAFDGRGNAVVRSEKDIKKSLEKLNNKDLYVEKYVPFIKELAIMVARSPKGDIQTYPVVETVQYDNICDIVIAPARVSKNIQLNVKKLAKKTMKSLKGAGVFGIEMFLTKDGKVLINEIAPRVHNSGHYTIEACLTSQFEQHIRAITGLPLGKTDMIAKTSIMKNILGTKKLDSFPEGLEKVLQIPGVSFHYYGKTNSRPARKMGHLTVIGDSYKQCLKKVTKARKLLDI